MFFYGVIKRKRMVQNRFSLDTIDRSFINEVTNNTASANIVEGILYLSQKLNLTTTAEGIETPEQKDFLQNSGCQYAQGYLCSLPLSSDNVISFIRKQCKL
ncbi:hypothetical protein cce_1435 [Crocosphaera subtropica ATCC 51142]|uniref:EAL domain-containing protein n=2 Tax=Crocosphaera TaxID=263510 RepID=B1WWR1_CROS5|nr:hypothetical protein cce_1435 [Crocosphaera subtropica ATCC 51142]